MYTVEPGDFPLIEEVMRNLDSFLEYFDEKGDFSVTFVSDDEIRTLNREYRNIDSPTDILTFRLADWKDELRRLLLHGLMHLRGWDHSTNDFSAEPMLIEQEKILKTVR